MKIVVAICTRNRPAMLRDCLASLFAQEVPEGIEAIALVVENNQSNACSGLVASAGQTAPPHWRVCYALETELGIPMARNRALAIALEHNPEWIAFIDDDELACPGWLPALLRCASRFSADVVHGPVHFDYATAPPAWLPAQSRKSRQSGTRLFTAHTNNVLMRADIARKGMRFDETMRFSGGRILTSFIELLKPAGSYAGPMMRLYAKQ